MPAFNLSLACPWPVWPTSAVSSSLPLHRALPVVGRRRGGGLGNGGEAARVCVWGARQRACVLRICVARLPHVRANVHGDVRVNAARKRQALQAASNQRQHRLTLDRRPQLPAPLAPPTYASKPQQTSANPSHTYFTEHASVLLLACEVVVGRRHGGRRHGRGGRDRRWH